MLAVGSAFGHYVDSHLVLDVLQRLRSVLLGLRDIVPLLKGSWNRLQLGWAWVWVHSI